MALGFACSCRFATLSLAWRWFGGWTSYSHSEDFGVCYFDDTLMLSVSMECVKRPPMDYRDYLGRYGEKISFSPRKFCEANGELK